MGKSFFRSTLAFLGEKGRKKFIPTEKDKTEKQVRALQKARAKRMSLEAKAARAKELIKERRKIEQAEKTIRQARETRQKGFNLPDFDGFMGFEDPFASKPKKCGGVSYGKRESETASW